MTRQAVKACNLRPGDKTASGRTVYHVDSAIGWTTVTWDSKETTLIKSMSTVWLRSRQDKLWEQ